MINFGTFHFKDCIIKRFEVSKYTHSKFNKGNPSYNLYVRKADCQEEEDFFVICNHLNGFDITHAERYSKLVSIEGDILKNPSTHKTIYVVNENGFIKEQD